MTKNQSNRKKNNKNKKIGRKMKAFNQPGERLQSKLFERIPRFQPIPVSTRVVLRYNDFYNYSSSGGIASFVYAGNSAFDPDVTFTGHQPYYYDRYTGPYQKYVVMGSKIRYEILSEGGSAGGIMFGALAYYLNTVPSTGAGLREICENVNGKSIMIPANTIKPYILNLQSRSSYMLNTSENEMGTNAIWRTDYNANPTNQWNYKALAANVDAAATLFTLSINVTIEYDILFSVLADEPPSTYPVTSGHRVYVPE
jgi:hypothetical protein